MQRPWVPQWAWWPGRGASPRPSGDVLRLRPAPAPCCPSLGRPRVCVDHDPSWGPPGLHSGPRCPLSQEEQQLGMEWPPAGPSGLGSCAGPWPFWGTPHAGRRTLRARQLPGSVWRGLGAIRASAKERGGVRAAQAGGALRPGDPASSSTRVQFRPWRASVSLLGHRQDVKASPER